MGLKQALHGHSVHLWLKKVWDWSRHSMSFWTLVIEVDIGLKQAPMVILNTNYWSRLCIVLSNVFFSIDDICPYWLARGDNWDFRAPPSFDVLGENDGLFCWDHAVASSFFFVFLCRRSVGLVLRNLPSLQNKEVLVQLYYFHVYFILKMCSRHSHIRSWS